MLSLVDWDSVTKLQDGNEAYNLFLEIFSRLYDIAKKTFKVLLKGNKKYAKSFLKKKKKKQNQWGKIAMKHSKYWRSKKKSYYSNLTNKYKDSIKKTWYFMRETIGKFKLKTKELPHRTDCNRWKGNNWWENNGEKLNRFRLNIETKLASKIPVSNTHFKQYVKYESSNLEQKNLKTKNKIMPSLH